MPRLKVFTTLVICAMSIGSVAAQERGPETGANCLPTPDLDTAPEWGDSDATLPSLIGGGDFEIRAAYRVAYCQFGLTVYVLQGIADRRQVYECISDDSYRAPFPCKQLKAPPR